MKNMFFTVALLFLATVSFSQVFTGKSNKETVLFADQKAVLQYNAGIEYYNDNQPDSAVSCFTRALSFDPASYDARYNRAVIYYEKGQYKKAIDDLIVLKQTYTNAEVYRLLGDNFREMNQLTTALTNYKEASVKESSNAINAFNIGAIYLAKQQYDEAIDAFTTAIGMDSDFAIAYNDRGIAYREKGDINSARDDFQKATLLDPKMDFSFSNLGDIRMKMKQFK